MATAQRERGLTFGERLRILRKGRGIDSMAELARRSDVAMTTIYRLETGRSKHPTYETLTKLAHALDVAVGDLVDPSTR